MKGEKKKIITEMFGFLGGFLFILGIVFGIYYFLEFVYGPHTYRYLEMGEYYINKTVTDRELRKGDEISYELCSFNKKIGCFKDSLIYEVEKKKDEIYILSYFNYYLLTEDGLSIIGREEYEESEKLTDEQRNIFNELKNLDGFELYY